MELGALRIFLTVAETASVSRAARRLDYVQSNVTARIQQLEDELQTTLFYRKPRGMILTPAGRTLQSYADRVLRLIDEARDAVQATDMVKGSITLGSMETTAAVRLPPILTEYHQRYPDVMIGLKTGTSEEMIAGVLNYELDGAFVGGPISHPEIEQTPVFNEELVFITERCVRSLEEMPQRTLLVFRQGCSYRARLEHLLRERGILPYRIMEFGTLDAILGCIAAGMGVSLLPRSVVARPQYAENIALHPVPSASAQVTTMFVRRHDTLRTPAVDAFLELACVGEAGSASLLEPLGERIFE